MGENRVSIKIDNLAGKQEEIEVLRKLHNRFKSTGLYLESVFSSGLLSWVERALLDDICPDIHDWMDSAIRNLQGRLVESEREWKVKVDDAERSKKIAVQHRDEFEALYRDAKSEKDSADQLFSNELRLHSEANVMVNRLEQELEEAKDELEVLKRDYEAKVMALKARLYDIEHPEKTKTSVKLLLATDWVETPVGDVEQ